MKPDADQDAAIERFLHRVREQGQVWGLKSANGWAVCESGQYEDTLVYPFWSDAAAAFHCTGDWGPFTATAIPLDEFVGHWLPGMDEDDVLVGTDWDADLSGPEWEPMDLANELDLDGPDADDDLT